MTATARAIQIILQAIMIVVASLVVIRMTARTGGRVSRRRPVHCVRIGIVALGAVEIAAVIKRLVSQPGVTEIRRSPPIRGMALATIHGSVEVTRILAGGIGAVVAG